MCVCQSETADLLLRLTLSVDAGDGPDRRKGDLQENTKYAVAAWC